MNRPVGEVGLGTWQLGAGWGNVTEEVAMATLRAAYESGVTVFDTADVYGNGRSERFIGKFLAEMTGAAERLFIASKCGRLPTPGWPHNFSREVIRQHTEDTIKRLGVEALDLQQLHCVPTEILKRGELLGWLGELQAEGKIRGYGASVESMEEALYCVEHSGVSALQIIFNIFRQKPVHTLFAAARAKGVALIVRLPLASGLLTGKMTKDTQFERTDHRNFNRDGKLFNVGETFAGLPFAKGVELADAVKTILSAEAASDGATMAELALRWCLDFDAVSVVIPGARNPDQARANVRASALPPLGAQRHVQLAALYEREVAAFIRGPY